MFRLSSLISPLIALGLCCSCSESAVEASAELQAEPPAATPELGVEVQEVPLAGAVQTPLDEPAAAPQQEGTLETQSSPLILRVTEPMTGDLDLIEKREVLRVLVSHSRTNFFLSKGKLRGFEYEMFRELQEHLDEITPKGSPAPIVAFLPVPFDELLPALLEGRGDVAASSLTITPERSALVSFSAPYLKDVEEILVAHSSAPTISSWKQLAGQEIHVVSGSSYAEHLRGMAETMKTEGLEPIIVREAGRGISTEDLLEMVSSGALQYTVADRYLVELWSGVLEGLRMHPELTTGHTGQLAWAVRPGSPKLKAMLDSFVAKNRKGTLIGNVLFKRYYGKTDWLNNPLFDLENSRLAPFLPKLQAYSEQYGFDWRLIAAQAYQESGLDPLAVSRSGAVGLMQLLPSTAKDMGVTELTDPSENMRAGIKYMNWLREHFFDEPDLDPAVQIDFALAAYNAGPSNVKRWRAAAPERGLDPNRWFGNVELIALETIGAQPVQYVGNINKYFVIFSLTLDEMQTRDDARSELIEASSR